MADNQMNDSTSFQQAELPIMCANGCGFYGTSTTMNMCSKCYRDHKREENQNAAVVAAVENSFLPPAQAQPVTLVVSDSDKSVASASSSAPAGADEQAKAETVPKMKNRCDCCRKKVGMLGFQCKCGKTFCGTHRYPDEHKCTYDFVGVGKKAIAKANPLIKADKLAWF